MKGECKAHGGIAGGWTGDGMANIWRLASSIWLWHGTAGSDSDTGELLSLSPRIGVVDGVAGGPRGAGGARASPQLKNSGVPVSGSPPPPPPGGGGRRGAGGLCAR
jgi:hypothetical protein